MKKVCVITSTRAEYGLLRWTIEEFLKQDSIETQVVVTGTHLSQSFGYTCSQIENDGIAIDVKVPYISNDRTSLGIIKECAVCLEKIGDAFSELTPDLLLVLGDRYELLPICSAALLLNIPIAHIAGGEVTEGAIDDNVRNAITMMASLHFPNNEEAANNIVRMKGNSHLVYNVGEPGIENYYRLYLKDRSLLAEELNIDSNKRWILVTLHPETKQSIVDNKQMASNMMMALQRMHDVEIVISESNADFGGDIINDLYKKYAEKNENIHVFHSLGQINYLSFMKQAWCVIGNSSSGLIETPYLGIPTINIGNRQKGRKMAANIIQCSAMLQNIITALDNVEKGLFCIPDYSFGDGKTSIHIVEHVKEYFYESK